MKRINQLRDFFFRYQADTLIADLIPFCDNSSEHYLITTFRNKVAELPDLTAEEQASYCIENEGAFREYILPAYEALRDFLVEHKGSGSNSAGLCYFPDGSDYYAAWFMTPPALPIP